MNKNGLSQETKPAAHARRVLLAIAGTTPQIITSTLWALTRPEYGFVPTEIHILTTAGAEGGIRENLLDEQNGQFHRFCRDFGYAGQIAFSAKNITILKDFMENPLQDIVTPDDNNLAADQITSWLREFTSDPDCAIHACLAGGRKTMGFYLGYGLSLFGRPQDRLSHVLASQEFESSKAYYPSPSESEPIGKMDVATLDERKAFEAAKIRLAEIPVVRLRFGLSKSLLEGKSSYTETVESAQKELPDNRLVIDENDQRIICGGVEIDMQPKARAFYIWHARRKLTMGDAAPISWKDASGKENKEVSEYLDSYLKVLGGDRLSPDYLEANRAYKDGFEKDSWADVVKKANDRLDILGERNAHAFKIIGQNRNRSRLKHYSLQIPSERIVFRNSTSDQAI